MNLRSHTALLVPFLTGCLVAAHPSAQAQTQAEKAFTYYGDKARGWHWKEVVPVPVEPEPVEGAATRPPQPVAKEEQEPAPVAHAPAPAPAPAGPKPFSPKWLREKMPEYRDRAIADPSTENVRAYYYIQRYAMDMAERFAHKAQKVVLADPILDENSRRPLSDYGAELFDRQAREATDAVAAKVAEMAGIWYFYRTDCPYCAAQNPVVTNLQRKLDLAILPIALDGQPMEGKLFEQYVHNTGQAESLKVRATPTLYMVRPPGDFVLLSEGLVTESSLKKRMILGAHEAGWITDAELNSTKPVNQIQIQADLGTLEDDVLNDPQKLAALLRAKIIGTAN